MANKTQRICKVHVEECGEHRPVVRVDREFGPVCEECAREIGQSRSAERQYDSGYAYACGERA